jgi:molybdate transport system substrate-binding protein
LHQGFSSMKCEIAGISSMATRQILADLARRYEQQTGCRITMRAMGGVDAARLIRAGEPTDVVVLASEVMKQLEAEGNVLGGSLRAFARSGMAMAVRSGAPRPSIADEESVKQAILRARAVGYSSGPSGDHLLDLWKQWGIADVVSQRAIKATPGVPVGTMVASGEVDLGFQQLSELLDLPGIDIVGPLPPEIQALTVFSAGICNSSAQVESARALVAYLASPEAGAAKREHGMEPA